MFYFKTNCVIIKTIFRNLFQFERFDTIMKKIKMLVVAPYEGMAESIATIAKERNDIEVTIQTGDLSTGKNIAIELSHNNYDVIISRGGTAELIRSAVEIPVVEVSISVYDVLCAIKLAESYSGKFVIAGFSGITYYARLLCDLLQYDIDIITFTSEEDALPALRDAKKKGCKLVLCDMLGSSIAKKLWLNAILIPSGVESITMALNEAVELVHSSRYVHKQKDLFQALLTSEDREFLIYDPAGKLWFSSSSIEQTNTALMNIVQSYIKSFLKTADQTIARQIRDKVYVLKNSHIYYDEQKYTAITIQQKDALFSEEDLGITIYNKSDGSPSDFINYYSSSNNVGDLSNMIEEYSKTNIPVLIIGEVGTGKDKAASLLYENGAFDKAPFYTIDCAFMGERKWNNLISSENSPLNTLHNTIYLKNVGALSKLQLNKLFTYIEQTKLIKKNRLIFSLVLNNKEHKETETARTYLENTLKCLTLKLPPLRERIEDISSISALYIHKLNISSEKQIIGLEAEAMELLQSFAWPHNLDQLQHVLKELVVITHTPYITCKSVQQVLKQEQNICPFEDMTSVHFDLSQTLDAINYQIIITVLKQENGNKEKTSKRLGISRSTLWRILKNYSV